MTALGHLFLVPDPVRGTTVEQSLKGIRLILGEGDTLSTPSVIAFAALLGRRKYPQKCGAV